MRRFSVAFLSLLPFVISGCGSTSEKNIGLWIVYAVAVLLSFLIALGYCLFKRTRNRWYVVLFLSVLLVNTGYLLLSLSGSLEAALHANRLSYLGSVFLPLSMLMIIGHACDIRYSKRVVWGLIGLAILAFLIAGSPGYLDVYYKDVRFERIHGIGVLYKEYGALHSCYTVYLLGYFAAMIATIVYAVFKRRLMTPAYAVILASAVFINICVWLVEKFVYLEFELLSISYIVTEIFLLGLDCLASENEKRKSVPVPITPEVATAVDFELQAKLGHFTAAVLTLTHKELEIFRCYADGMTTQEVLDHLGIKENTLKFHNKNLYAKLDVANRRQLLEFHKLSDRHHQ